MSVFVNSLNITTGEMELIAMDESYDYRQQIARSSYADMLHDDDRNKKYYFALKKVITQFHANGKEAHVLDIGTGTGILSMMAAKLGADSIFACEAFKPMAQCAEKIIRQNNLHNTITVIPKESTELKVGQDLPRRANILVTEVFDTELIGEGAIRTFSHAAEELLEPDAVIIPSVGRVYAAVYESRLLDSFNRLYDVNTVSNNLQMPSSMKMCCGNTPVHDVQLSELPTSSFQLISAPIIVKTFNWNDSTKLNSFKYDVQELRAERSGTAHGVFMWWDLLMDPEGEIILSCFPKWFVNNVPYAWRDHWMQAVYYFSKPIKLELGQQYNLCTYNDKYSFLFDISHNKKFPNLNIHDETACACLARLMPRLRIGLLNDSVRSKKYKQLLSDVVDKNSVCLCIGESGLLALTAATMGAKFVILLSTGKLKNSFIEIAEKNELQNKFHYVSNEEELKNYTKQNKIQISAVFAEPYFATAILPWHHLRFWYLRNKLMDIIPDDTKIFPVACELYLLPVKFNDLWKIRAPVGKIEGFDLEPFNELIQDAVEDTDETIDAQPLWEYPCIALSKPQKFSELSFSNRITNDTLTYDGSFNFETDGICNAIVLWVNWILTPGVEISTGPVESVTVNKQIKWDMFTKQGVYFLKKQVPVNPNDTLLYSIKFFVNRGGFEYCFKII